MRGGLSLGVAVSLERGLNFLANLLAARIAGPQMFGTYSIVLTTAGTVATYAGAGIGATANRFAGQYPRDSRAYRRLLRALLLVSTGSAVLAAVLMFAAAGPLARNVLRNESLTGFLQLAAFSAGALVLLECCRGLLIGQHKFPALLLLSIILGCGLVIALPGAASISAGAMVAAQAGVGLLAVTICALFARQLGITPLPIKDTEGSAAASAATEVSGVRGVVTFGLVQLGAVISLNIAGWWITSLVVRTDATLIQMGIYAVANQFRQLASIIPDLLARVCYPLLTKESGEEYGGPDRVMLVNTFVTTVIALCVAGIAVTALPWLLQHLYGESYTAGELPCALLLATAVVHMSGAPAANRVNIIALHLTSIINVVWTVVLITIGIFLVPAAGATGAAATFLITHILSAALVLIVLKRAAALPQALLKVSATGIAGALALAGFAFLRLTLQSSHDLLLVCALGAVLVGVLLVFVRLGQKERLLPQKISVGGMFSRMFAR